MKKELKDDFYIRMKEYLSKFGFKLLKTYLEAKKGKPVKSKIYFSTNSNSYGCGYFEPHFFIYNDEFRLIKSNLNKYYEWNYHRMNKPVIGAHVRDITNNYSKEYLNWISKDDGSGDLLHMICDEKSMNRYMDYFKRFMEEVGIGFINSFESIEGYDKWFNFPYYQNDYTFKPYGELNHRPIWGLIAAKLSSNPDYERIYQYWLEQDLPQPYIEKDLNNMIDYTIDIRQELKDLKVYLDENYPANG